MACQNSPSSLMVVRCGALTCLKDGEQGEGREAGGRGMAVLTSKWEGKNRGFSLGNSPQIVFYSVLQELSIRVDLDL